MGIHGGLPTDCIRIGIWVQWYKRIHLMCFIFVCRQCWHKCMLYINNVPLMLAAPNYGELTWFPGNSSTSVLGKPFHTTATNNFYSRLPATAHGVVRPVIWSESKQPAGLFLQFKTNASCIVIRHSLKSPSLSMWHFPSTGGISPWLRHALMFSLDFHPNPCFDWITIHSFRPGSVRMGWRQQYMEVDRHHTPNIPHHHLQVRCVQ